MPGGLALPTIPPYSDCGTQGKTSAPPTLAPSNSPDILVEAKSDGDDDMHIGPKPVFDSNTRNEDEQMDA